MDWYILCRGLFFVRGKRQNAGFAFLLAEEDACDVYYFSKNCEAILGRQNAGFAFLLVEEDACDVYYFSKNCEAILGRQNAGFAFFCVKNPHPYPCKSEKLPRNVYRTRKIMRVFNPGNSMVRYHQGIESEDRI